MTYEERKWAMEVCPGCGESEGKCSCPLSWSGEAWEAFTTGGEWEWWPDCGADGEFFAEWCDDCETWHGMHLVTGYAVHDGQVWVTQAVIDEDGDGWGDRDECALLDPNLQHWQDTAIDRGWEREYLTWLAETGDDQADLFMGYFAPTSPDAIRQRAREELARLSQEE